MVLFFFGLLPLLGLPSTRFGFYAGLTLGFAIYAPHLGFFWTLFGPAAVALWCVLALWPAVFLALGRTWASGTRAVGRILLIPTLWMGLEFFRSELYPLRFSWLTPALALSLESPMGLLRLFGVYGTSWVLMLPSSLFWFGGVRGRAWSLALAIAVVVGNRSIPIAAPGNGSGKLLEVAGAQTESLEESELPGVLDQLVRTHPGSELLVLPEYTLGGAPPPAILDWCARHRRHLIVGGRATLPNGSYYNTAWVIDPRGRIAFQQAKSVPIQFFQDGLPAPRQTLWASPWGPIGIAICYDLSYRRVMDRLVHQGAQALVIPTMDSRDWGQRQHALHARIAPARAVEYGLPIVRCASSGISQIVDRRGQVTAGAPTDDSIRLFSGTIRIHGPGHLPPDRWLAPIAAAIPGMALLGFAIRSPTGRRPRTPAPSHPEPRSP